ncbi:hypothetical protein ACE4RR_10785 [Alteribacillus sp. HJP-4]
MILLNLSGLFVHYEFSTYAPSKRFAFRWHGSSLLGRKNTACGVLRLVLFLDAQDVAGFNRPGVFAF